MAHKGGPTAKMTAAIAEATEVIFDGEADFLRPYSGPSLLSQPGPRNPTVLATDVPVKVNPIGGDAYESDVAGEAKPDIRRATIFAKLPEAPDVRKKDIVRVRSEGTERTYEVEALDDPVTGHRFRLRLGVFTRQDGDLPAATE